MRRILNSWILILVLSGTTQAALVVTVEDRGAVSRQYFENGSFVLVEQGRPVFGIDGKGICWFVDRGTLVSDPCDSMLQSMGGMREQAMAGLSKQDRAMMERMMGMQNSGQVIKPKPLGQKTVAGYSASCYSIGGAREYCVSADLMKQVKAEMGGQRFMEMFQQFGDSAKKMGGANPEAAAIMQLADQGYPVWDMQKAGAMPGMNQAMMQFLPPAQRAQIMQQLGAAGDGRTEGSKVVAVDRNGKMPSFDLDSMPRTGFAEFMRRNMGQMGGRPMQK